MPLLPSLPRNVLTAGLLGVMLSMPLLPGAAVQAQSGDPDKQLRALDSEDYRDRQDQTHRLLADTSLAVEDLAGLMDAAASPEQRHRLLTVARHHVLRERREQMFDRPDRGSLGISHRTIAPDDLPGDTGGHGAAVEIVLTLPGFPAYAALEVGDRIVAVDDQPLPPDFTADHFRELIVNFRSGETIKLTLDRHGERIDRTIELVSAQALTAMYDPTRLQLRPQFEDDWLNVRRRLLADAPDRAPLRLPADTGE
ncbi:MAG: PDZ domain-containing protein [Phycisphaeraceae bacterium]